MNYQTIEQLACKLGASDDIVSQFVCHLDFEKAYPPGSQAFADLMNMIESVAIGAG